MRIDMICLRERLAVRCRRMSENAHRLNDPLLEARMLLSIQATRDYDFLCITRVEELAEREGCAT